MSIAIYYGNGINHDEYNKYNKFFKKYFKKVKTIESIDNAHKFDVILIPPCEADVVLHDLGKEGRKKFKKLIKIKKVIFITNAIRLLASHNTYFMLPYHNSKLYMYNPIKLNIIKSASLLENEYCIYNSKPYLVSGYPFVNQTDLHLHIHGHVYNFIHTNSEKLRDDSKYNNNKQPDKPIFIDNILKSYIIKLDNNIKALHINLNPIDLEFYNKWHIYSTWGGFPVICRKNNILIFAIDLLIDDKVSNKYFLDLINRFINKQPDLYLPIYINSSIKKKNINLGIYIGIGVLQGLLEFIEALIDKFNYYFIKDFASYNLDNLDGVIITGGFSQQILRGIGKDGFINIKKFIKKNKFYIGFCAGVLVLCDEINWSIYDEKPWFKTNEPYIVYRWTFNVFNLIKSIHGPIFNIENNKLNLPDYYLKKFYGIKKKIIKNNKKITYNTYDDVIIKLDNNQYAEYRDGGYHLDLYNPKAWITEATFNKVYKAILYNKNYLLFMYHLERINPKYLREVVYKFLDYHYKR